MNPTKTETSELEMQLDESMNSGDELNLLDLFVGVARRKKLILQVTATGAALACVIAFLLPARYTATTRIMPPQQNQSLASAIVGQLAGGASVAALAGKDLGLKNPNDVYVGLLRSRTIQDALVSRFNLTNIYGQSRKSDAGKTLQRATAIEIGKDSLISISVEDKNAGRSAEMANAYVEELRRLTQTLAISEASQRRLFFEQQLQQAKEQLANAEVNLKQTQQNTGIIELNSQAKATIESVANLRGMIAAKEVQLQAMRTFATDQNPDRLRTEQELAGLRAQLVKLEQEQTGGKGDIAVATSKVPEAGLEYLRRVRDVKYQEAVYEAIAKQFEIAKLDEANNAAVIQVVDYAVVPDVRSSPKRILIILAGLLASFAAAVLWCMILHVCYCLNQNPETREQVSELRRALTSR